MVMGMFDGNPSERRNKKRHKRVSAVNGGPGKPRRNKLSHIPKKERKKCKWVKGGRLIRSESS